MIRWLTGAAAILVTASALCSAADLYDVGGAVLNSASNAPLPNAYVYFYANGTANPPARSITGGDGRFRFQLPAGTYRMYAGTRDTWETYGSRNPAGGFGSAVIVGPGRDTSNLVFRFFPPAAISGHIVDEAGEPAADILVQLIRSIVRNGSRSAEVMSFVRTDDRGEYRFGHLAGGVAYYLAVSGRPWYAVPNVYSGAATAQTASVAYRSQYYPDTSDPAKATPLLLRPGQEASADFRLATTANARLTVRANLPPGIRGTITLSEDGVAGTVAIQQSRQLPNLPVRNPLRPEMTPAPQILDGIPPGRYKLKIGGTVGSAVYGATVPVDVNGSDIAVDADVRPYSRIEGIVHFPPGFTLKGVLGVVIRGTVSGSTGSTAVKSDGSFTLPNVESGRFLISISGGGVFATRMDARNGVFREGLLEVPVEATVNLSITVSNQVGGVRGYIRDGHRPVEGVLALLVPRSESGEKPENGMKSLAFQTESDGSFDFQSVPAGSYSFFATEDTEIEYSRPEVLAPYLSAAKSIEVRTGPPLEEDLTLIPTIAH